MMSESRRTSNTELMIALQGLKESLDGLTRATYGHNGSPGMLTRISNIETRLDRIDGRVSENERILEGKDGEGGLINKMNQLVADFQSHDAINLAKNLERWVVPVIISLAISGLALLIFGKL